MPVRELLGVFGFVWGFFGCLVLFSQPFQLPYLYKVPVFEV